MDWSIEKRGGHLGKGGFSLEMSRLFIVWVSKKRCLSTFGFARARMFFYQSYGYLGLGWYQASNQEQIEILALNFDVLSYFRVPHINGDI